MPDVEPKPSDDVIVRKSVAEALNSKTGDLEFIKRLNEIYRGFAEAAPTPKRSRSRAASPIRVASPNLDPRYAANARKLAEEAMGGPRVVGGQPVPKGMFLDCVAVGSGTQWVCTGTLIAPNVVLTAGHCADYAQRIFVGEQVPPNGADPDQYGIVVGATPKRHRDYKSGTEENDLTVLMLDEPIDVFPRRIAPPELIDGAAFGRVVGFGNTNLTGTSGYGTKLWVDVPIASPKCSGNVGAHTDSAAYGCFFDKELVAGKPLLAKDSCTGDSGGPFYLDAGNGEWFVAGATSRATNKAAHDCGDGGIYVRLDAYRDWIAAEAKITLQ